MDYIIGYDLSHWNIDKQWDYVKKNSGFQILKATESIKYVDKTFHRRCMESILSGNRVGAYHFLKKDMDIIKQVEHFYNNVKVYIELLQKFHKSNDIPFLFFIDFEDGTIEECRLFVSYWEKLTDYPIIIYTGYSNYLLYEMNLDDCHKYWIAGYTSDKKIDERINNNENIAFYQYTSTYRLCNKNIDRDYWIKSRKQWISIKGDI